MRVDLAICVYFVVVAVLLHLVSSLLYPQVKIGSDIG